MPNPILTINNAARRAADGSGDGTIYATATGATVDQANKRFTLAGLAIIADLGADADDKFNGYDLYFPASKTYYLITDWTAASDQATVDDVPATIDTGACEIRRRLYAPAADAAFPITRAVNGHPSLIAKILAANVALTIDVALPNLVGQAGFEELPAGALPSTEQAAGKWWSTAGITVSATTPLLGSRMAVWDTAANDTLQERLVLPKGGLKKGTRYRVLLKVQAVTGATLTGALGITVVQRTSGANLDADFGGAGSWNPGIIGTTAAWITQDLIPDADTDTAKIMVAFTAASKGAATAVWVDEIAMWEVVPVASLLAFSHNWDGSPGPSVVGYRCPVGRTGLGAGDSVTLLAATAVAGTVPLRRTWTVADPPTADQAFPVYRITIAAHANYQYEVGELLLGQSWAWLSVPELGLDPQAREYDEQRRRAKAGAETRTLYSEHRRIESSIRTVKAADRAIWSGIFRERHRKGGEPFAAYWSGHWDELLLLTCQDLKMPYRTIVPDVAFTFVEAK